jgi:hypothetical protein
VTTADISSLSDEYWWYGEKCSVDDFSDRLASMLISELSMTISEMSGIISRLNRFVNDASNDEAERAEAQHGVTRLGEKRGIARRAATKLHAQLEVENKERLDRLDDLLTKVDLLADENPSAAMRTLVAALRSYWKIDEQLAATQNRINASRERESEPEREPEERPKPPARSRRPRTFASPEVLIARRPRT